MKLEKIFILVGVSFFLLFTSGCGYNTLVAQQQNVKAKWANVEAQLQRRADLVPNLVKAAQMAGIQEQEVFGQIAEARSRLLNATQAAPSEEKTPEQRQAVIEAANSFGGTIGRLLMLQEQYPQLRSNELFLKTQDELAGTENRIAVARTDYNNAVREYNTSLNQFPTVITAKLFGFKEEPYFQAQEGAQSAPSLPDPNTMRKNQK
ncbi:MAG: LemA family protein [Pyrinomonadaceae bacterium]|nr:LemA family protein [Pyrinomonadaceae bacterium]MCX7640903.1 LemA family protein [Pyrinomonadaceae bacterium]MDW8305370.1 LemA family protein [Acidobacteriota bacterium]